MGEEYVLVTWQSLLKPPPYRAHRACVPHIYACMHTPVDSAESITVCGILVRLPPQQHLGTLAVVPLGCQHQHWLVVSLEQGKGREGSE